MTLLALQDRSVGTGVTGPRRAGADRSSLACSVTSLACWVVGPGALIRRSSRAVSWALARPVAGAGVTSRERARAHLPSLAGRVVRPGALGSRRARAGSWDRAFRVVGASVPSR